MAKPIQSIDPKGFAKRLHAALDRYPDVFPLDRGRTNAVTKHFKVKQPTATAWLTGAHMPSPEKVLEMAIELNQDFMHLYFGDAAERIANSATSKPSQPVRYDAEMLGDAMTMLDMYYQILGEHIPARHDPEMLAIACEAIAAGGVERDDAKVLLYLSQKMKGRSVQNGDEQGETKGASDGYGRARKEAKAAGGRDR